MPKRSTDLVHDPERLDQIKALSGRIIEERRKRARMTQSRLAAKIGIGTRWLREIESGNPSSTIECHLRCAFALGLGASHLLIPLMFMENDMKFPIELLLDDPDDLDQHFIACIGDYYVESVARRMRRPSPPGPRDAG